MNRAPADTLLETITAWAKAREEIRGLALVGSYAREAAQAGSDIDLVLLTRNPCDFRDAASLETIDWRAAGVHPTEWSDEEYGAVWSRRIWLEPEYEIEFAFAALSWANVWPVDKGTHEVVSNGCRILYDPDGLLERLKAAVTWV